MKTFIQIIFGLVVFPVIMIVLFSAVNWVISLLFGYSFMDVQRSMVWVLYTFIIIVMSVFYLAEVIK